jgi:hypothetical protein
MLVERIGHLVAVDPPLIFLVLPRMLEVGVLLPVTCGINQTNSIIAYRKAPLNPIRNLPDFVYFDIIQMMAVEKGEMLCLTI